MLHADHAATGLAALDGGAQAPLGRRIPARGRARAFLRPLGAMLLAWMACASQAQVIVAASAFETDRDGWTEANLDPAFAICCGFVTWTSSGGSPGGYVMSSTLAGYNAFNAPAEFLGDMSAVLDGSLKFEQLGIRGGSAGRQPWVVISDGTLTLQWMGTGPEDSAWLPYSIDFDVRAGWQVMPAAFGEDGQLATRGQIKQVLSDLKLLRIAVNPYFLTGLDQVRLLAPVPEPGPAALWMAGLGALAWLRRHRRSV